MTGRDTLTISERPKEGDAAMMAFGAAVSVREQSAAEKAPRFVREWRLSEEHSLQVGLRVGDALHIKHGTVWLGVAGFAEPIVLSAGESYTATSDATFLLMGCDDPTVAIHSNRPVMVSVRADYGAWRYR